jgi:hypothetical protein
MSLKNQIIGGLTVSQRDKVLNMLREWIKFKGETVAQSTHNQQNVYHYVFNNSGETIPAYACVQVTGTKELGEQNYLIGEKPADGTGDAGWYVFNGFEEIADQEIGICYDGPLVRALVDGNLSAGDLVSPQADSWSLAEGSLFPYAGPDDILPNTHKVFVTGGGGGGCEMMEFTVNEVYGTETAASDHCDDQLNDSLNQYKVSCSKSCCGKPPSGAEEDGSYIVHDMFSMFQGGIDGARENADVVGKSGLAIRMSDCDGYDDCKWYVIFINWFRTIQVITNVKITDDDLIFERENVEVWDNCELDPIKIPLTDCEEY